MQIKNMKLLRHVWRGPAENSAQSRTLDSSGRRGVGEGRLVKVEDLGRQRVNLYSLLVRFRREVWEYCGGRESSSRRSEEEEGAMTLNSAFRIRPTPTSGWRHRPHA